MLKISFFYLLALFKYFTLPCFLVCHFNRFPCIGRDENVEKFSRPHVMMRRFTAGNILFMSNEDNCQNIFILNI